MSKIVSKLDLNKTPQLVDNNSLIFAKNIRVLKDGIIGPDFPIDSILSVPGVILGYIVGLNSTIYLFVAETSTISPLLNLNQFYAGLVPSGGTLNSYSLNISNKYVNHTYVWEKGQDLSSYATSTIISAFGGNLVRQAQATSLASHYPFTTRIEIEFSYILNDEEISGNRSILYERAESNIAYNIYSYNEVTKELYKINSAWSYSGGKIHGLCTTNNTGETILTVCEYFEDNSDISVPIKHINLSHADVEDETLYTQTPNIPLTNLILHSERYSKPIPNGVYQFFIRYKLYNDVYTEWFPCSEECFTGNINVTNTIQGSVKYVDTTLNSDESFIFTVDHLLNGKNGKPDYVKNFTEFQLGFIISHDDSVNARAWKHFTMSAEPIEIYFDYDENFITEINIDDLLRSVYEISNVKNVTYFRNKLYIANYEESNVNEDLSNYVRDINCEIVQDELDTETAGINLPIIPGTSYYDIEGRESDFITKFGGIENVASDTGDIFTIYYSSYSDFDPDVFFVRSGLEKSINNEKALPTFSIVPTNDDDDFEDILFRNTQNSNPSIKGQLLYGGHGNRNYSRINGTPDSVVQAQLDIRWTDDGKRTMYIHPLNDDINWVCLANNNTPSDGHLINPNKWINRTDIVGSNDGYYITPIKKQSESYTVSNLCHGNNVNWNDSATAEYWRPAEVYITKQIKEYIDTTYPAYILCSVALYSNNTKIDIVTEDTSAISRTISNFEGEDEIEISNELYNDFRGQCFTKSDYATIEDFKLFCKNYIIPTAIDGNANCYYKHNGTYYKIDRVEIAYKYVEYSEGAKTDLTINDDDEFEEIVVGHSAIKSTVTKYLMTVNYNTTDLSVVKTKFNIKSLLPFTDYNLYVHYIKKNGVATNGYLLDNRSFSLPEFDESFEHSVIYPTFDNITLPDNYIGCFFSIEKVGNDILSCFNYRTEGTKRIVDCLDIDCMLYPLLDNITIINSSGQVITNKAKYYPSSTTNPPIMLGNVGCVIWDENDELDNDTSTTSSDESVIDSSSSSEEYPRLWICVEHQSSLSNTNRLIKITPYIIGEEFTDYTKLNLPGYYCSVCKPKDIILDEQTNTWLYVNGSDVYGKKVQNNSKLEEALSIDEYEDLLAHVNTYNENYHVYSNFNLSYLSLYDMSYKDSKYKRVKKIDSETGEVVATYKQILFMLDSSTISYIYSLPSMYKDYTRKLYNSVQSDKMFKFDNTVRSSDVNSDEHYKAIYKFFAEDYYMVPANRGKIVNLFNITQNIFIHCEHSLFKFSGDNTLTAKDTEVQLTENDIFDTGIIELFDSEYGFAGLQVKHQSLITYNAYIFYDSIANTLYAYFGENNLVKLSDSIHKILSNREFTDVLFNADTENDRFFINFIYSDNSNLCLSYNFSTKSFVSIHDFTYTEGFFTRLGCYFLNFGKVNLFNVSKSAFAVLPDTNSSTSYSILYATSKLFISDMVIPEIVNYPVENCLDVVCNIEYEKVKVLNYINWICNQINKYADDIDGVNLFVADENISKYAGSKLRIYSDQCSTALIELEDNNGQIYEQNTEAIASNGSYEYPRYNCGVWSLNYFRDVKNIEDIFNYKNASPPTTQEEANNTGLVNSDRSLIYGKYFVLRLIFRNKNFKLENINFNIQDYEKV